MNHKRRLPIAREGFPYIFFLLGMGALFYLIGLKGMSLELFTLSMGVAFFFRDPERVVFFQEDVIISPADGKVVSIRLAENTAFPEGEALCVSIFLSIFNVHINRAPMTGQVVHTLYTSGQFFPAFREKASHLNEQNIILIKNGPLLVQVRQIAGLIARRMVCWVKEGDPLCRGDRLGLIKFGSRVDLFVPTTCRILVNRGEKVKGGKTVIARIVPEVEKG